MKRIFYFILALSFLSACTSEKKQNGTTVNEVDSDKFIRVVGPDLIK